MRTVSPLCLCLAFTCAGLCLGDRKAWASSSHRLGRLDGAGIRAFTALAAGLCLAACRDEAGCVSFNYQDTTTTCELLSTRLCDDEASALDASDPTWRYYDLLDDQDQEANHAFYSEPMCTDRGRCSPHCERQVNQECTDDIQCSEMTNNTRCSVSTNNTTGVCTCDLHYWAYNGSLCIHQTSLDSMTWTWIFKKIVNNMCDVTFTVRASNDLRIHLGHYEDWHDGIIQYYFNLGGWGNTQSVLDSRSTRIATVSTPQLLSNDFQNFTLHWCNGQIRVRLQGGNDFISWDDPTPFIVKTIGFFIPNNVHSHLFFPHNLVDPHFPTSVETRTVRTNGHHWHQCKILPDASQTSSIQFRFECMAVKDCKVIFGLRTSHARQYQVAFGADYNAITRLYNGRTGAWEVTVSTPSILSGTEYRRFWINVDGPSISVGQGDDGSAPLISYRDTVENTRTFTHVSIGTCCNDYGYWKIHSHPQFHDYPNGAYTI